MANLFNKVVATVGANSKAMVEKARINTTINNFETEKTRLIQLLGQKVYEMYKEQGSINVDEKITNFISEIDKRNDSIAEQKKELKRVEDELALVTGGGQNAAAAGGITCASCGHSNRDDAKFCTGCGGTISTTKCPSCGRACNEGVKFCTGCGSAINS